MAKGRKTGGRKPGSPNKLNAAVKDMILEALNELGGVSYLVEHGGKNPKAFLALVGRLVPIDMTAKVDGEIGMKPIMLGAPPPE